MLYTFLISVSRNLTSIFPHRAAREAKKSEKDPKHQITAPAMTDFTVSRAAPVLRLLSTLSFDKSKNKQEDQIGVVETYNILRHCNLAVAKG